MAWARLLLVLVVAPAARVVGACEMPAAGSPLDGLCAVVSAPCTRAPLIGVLSAFPYEQRALRTAATIAERVEIGGRPFYVGRLAGHRVVMALTGIGLVNATNTTRTLLDHFDVSTIVFSGVAGSVEEHIGDVLVPATWKYSSVSGAFAAAADLLAAAEAVAAAPPTFDRCTPVPLDPPGPATCVDFAPRMTVGGTGASSDPYNGQAFACTPGQGDVFGCDEAVVPTTPAAVESLLTPAGDTATVSIDMESAAVAEVAAGRDVPFVIVRGVSDGAGDPMHLTAPFAQFFIYYRLAADNAAAVATAILERLPGGTRGRIRRTHTHTAAACDFERAAGADCAAASASPAVARLVSQGCGLRARAAADGAAQPERLLARSAARWRRAATVVERSHLSSCCATALGARLRAAAALPID